MEVKTIGVLGAGAMGSGIAHVAAMSGYDVILGDVDLAIVDRAVNNMEKLMARSIEKGKMTEEQRAAALARISKTSAIEDFATADFVVEAIIEVLDVKTEAFRRLDAICRPEVVLASNTSSMSITEMANATRRPDRVVGMHFFNPVQVMRLVEVIRGYYTSDETVAITRGVAEKMGKTTVEVKKDVPGFVVNRVLMPMLVEALLLVQEGVATPEDVDKAVTLGLNHPMGPFTLLDFTGIDVCHHVMEYFAREFGQDKYAPPLLIKQMVRAGRLGRKTGRGFYDYEGQK